ncbi:MAG: phytoene desaturase family protein [Candidatus Bathyarchaeota archaeon]|nr:phytoene desaturase family protein [Candidatus Bathyarchaeota archaeon]
MLPRDACTRKSEKIGIIGAGPGGLSCAMLLAHKGFDVTVLEKASEVGGRSAPINLEAFKFDTGPTFLMMKYVLDELFDLCDRKSADYLQFKLLDPMYQLSFPDFYIQMSNNKERMRNELNRVFPGNEEGLNKFYSREKKKYERIIKNLYKDYSSLASFLSLKLIAALPSFFLGGSIFDNLGNYFKEEKLRICFTFQSKYLGMSPWECPAAFTIIPFVEHEYGIYHVIGGLNQISKAMAQIVKEENGAVITDQKVKKIETSGNKVTGVQLQDGKKLAFDKVIVNADFGYSMSKLFQPGKIKKYSSAKLQKKKFSCSAFMLYLGVDKKYVAPHHNIVFAEDYRKNISDIQEGRLSEDSSFYVQNASVTDDTLAPNGKSTIYLLVPVPNNRSNIDWNEKAESFKETLLNNVEERTPLKDLRDHIEIEKMITPKQWEQDYNVYIGSTFNLAHNLSQMLYFRPHNKFEELKNLYLVGGGTHPGSGLPTIYISGIVTAGLISKNHTLHNT